jgi:hypothetical protein
MQERDRKPGGGDVRGPTRGDFTDWDNPEDEIEEAPEGYYDEDSEEGYEVGPDDPDYDLSEGAGYSGWEGRGRRPMVPYWVIVALSLLFIFAMLIPALLRLN